MRTKEMTGKRFGKLLVIFREGSNKDKKAMWSCICGCGNKCRVSGKSLRLGYTQSCGCFQKERTANASIKHGMSKSVEYESYCGAKGRCENKKDERYKDYGGRGIKFIFLTFEQFYKELGPKPKGKSLDRIYNEGNYEPGNVKWSTVKQQNNNRRKRKWYKRNSNGTFK